MSSPISPAPGTTYSQRREFLYSAPRFIEIRLLGTMVYKKEDGTPLLTYEETLKDRDYVREIILTYELDHGLIVRDGESQQSQPTQEVFPQMAPPMSPPPFSPSAAPSPTFSPPTVPQGAPAFAPAPPPPPSAPQATGAQPAPLAPPATGRKAGGRKASTGASVAPPPVAVAVSEAVPAAQPTFSPPAVGFSPPAQPSFSPPVEQAPAPVQPGVNEKLDVLGSGLATISKQLSDLKDELEAQKKRERNVLGGLFQLAMSNPQSAAYLVQTNSGKPVDFNWFVSFAEWTAGNPK